MTQLVHRCNCASNILAAYPEWCCKLRLSKDTVVNMSAHVHQFAVRYNMLRRLSCFTGLSSLVCFTFLPTQPAAGCKSTPTFSNKADDPKPHNVGSQVRCGGSLASCALPTDGEELLYLTSLVPQNQIISTGQERVNFYIYIPPETNKLAVLEVLDIPNGEEIFEQEFELKTDDTIVRLVLPESVQLLSTPMAERLYWWRLSIYCDPNTDDTVSVEGWIHRLNSDDAATTPRLWHEDLEAWFAERETNPKAWQQGLAEENLGAYADRAVETYVLGN
ncbi:MAG: DUF928 domain-containing protein [Spirulina sp. SIO3F2]|nr:DUF928 domain-containing protein [Spirulina sp. SIO3F2]